MPESNPTEDVSGGATDGGQLAAAATKADSPQDDASEINPLTDFVTTSSVIESINASLESVMKQEGVDEGANRSFFELQKRMPDGSTRKATEEEMSSQDMKNKLEQAAALTSKMNLEEKIEWAQKQRQEGNALYQEGKYKQAIDIYLTCLVVRGMTEEKMHDQEVLILPVMNNLSQCAIQLGWYQKAELFCTLGMQSLDNERRGRLVAKLYFKRGKARRLRGCYDQAKSDLDTSLQKLDATEGGDTSPEQKAIEKEKQQLAEAVAEGKKNKKRAQRAMQKVFTEQDENSVKGEGGTSSTDRAQQSTGKSTKPPPLRINKDVSTTTPLYHEKQGRTHSTIRRRPQGPPTHDRPDLALELSYWQMYRLVLARVAQRLLDVIGEDETRSGSSNEGDDLGRDKQD